MLSDLWPMRGDAGNIPSPAESRRRALFRGGALLVALIAIAVAPSVLELVDHRDVGFGAFIFAVLGTLFIASLSQVMGHSFSSVWRLSGERGHLLAARTMTGWRTVDLTGIRRVHARFMMGGYGHAGESYVVVVDAGGSRVALRTNDPSTMRWIHDGIAGPKAAGVRASRMALIELEIRERDRHRYLRCHDAHPFFSMMTVWLVLVSIYVVAVAPHLQ